jgi:hypothetical protein
MKRISLALASALLLTSAGAASATDSGGIKIGGHVENDVYADYNYNYAFGSKATAKQNIGSFVGDVDVQGTVYNDVQSYDNENMADGTDAKACQNIGSIVGQEC